MTDKFNISKKKSNTQPYDSRITEHCEKCSAEIVYRRSSYFGKTTYYKICNSCGWYQMLDRETWRNVVNRIDPSAVAEEVSD